MGNLYGRDGPTRTVDLLLGIQGSILSVKYETLPERRNRHKRAVQRLLPPR